MIKKVLAFFARRSHNVKVQCLLATIYGLVSIFGIGGTINIMLKMKKQVEKENHARKAKG